jgi:RNase P/RNase MRP subunit p29
MIFICDEGVEHIVNADWAKQFAKVGLSEKLTVGTLFKELSQKFSLYCIRKHYIHAGAYLEGDKLVGLNAEIHKQWQGLIGAERVALLDDPKRVVDVILGLLAAETGKMDFFTKEITVRQTKDQVKTVMKSMASIAKKGADKSVHTGNSIIKRPKNASKKSKDSLL